MTFSILVDIFYSSAGAVFSKDGVFQHPRLFSSTIPPAKQRPQGSGPCLLNRAREGAKVGNYGIVTLRENAVTWCSSESVTTSRMVYAPGLS